MASSIYTFWHLLNGTKEQPAQGLVRIPIIQRDYAQGRTDEKTTLIRETLVADLHRALQGGPKLRLDFVYGSQEKGFIPLDGQQRLTTLFLLHWYLAARDGKLSVAGESLKRFTYETRTGASDFCQALAEWNPDFARTENVGAQLRDTAWFRPAWEFDPTVQGMLVMINALDQRFRPYGGLFDRLTGDESPIDFHFLDMKEVALTDDLYLKMNARGKPLTGFENWRAGFDKFLNEHHQPSNCQEVDKERSLVAVFGERMDGGWLDLFWDHRDKITALTDDAASNAVGYLTRMLAYELGQDEKQLRPEKGRYRLPFTLYEQVYANAEQVRALFGALDLLASWRGNSRHTVELPAELLGGDGIEEPVVLFGTKPNLLEQCLREKAPSLQAQVLLYSLLAYGLARQGQPLVHRDMRDLLRVVRNVLERERQHNDTEINTNLRHEHLARLIPAVSQLAHATARLGDAYIALKEADAKLLDGLGSKAGLHERAKAILLSKQEELRPVLHRLENLPVLHGDLHNLPFEAGDELVALEKDLTEIWTSGVEQNRIIAAWLTQGEYWVESGSTGWGDKYFLGNDDNWYTILAADEETVARSLPLLLRAYRHAEGADTGERLDWLRAQWLTADQDKQTWYYHVIAYPEMTRYRPQTIAGSFVWQSNFGLHLLRGSNLKSPHLNPYVRTVLMRKRLDGLVESEQSSWRNDKWYTPLRVLPISSQPEDLASPELHCEKQGWLLVIGEGGSLPQELILRHGLVLADQGGWWVPQPNDQDRIETVESFVLSMDWEAISYTTLAQGIMVTEFQ